MRGEGDGIKLGKEEEWEGNEGGRGWRKVGNGRGMGW